MSDRSFLRTTTARLMTLAFVLLAACTSAEPSATEPLVRLSNGSDDPTFLTATQGAAPSGVVYFWAKQGEDRTGEIFAVGGASGGNGDRLVRLRVRKDAQIILPSGVALANGDSVLISMQIIDPVTLSTQFEPSGLVFAGKKVAQLTMWYGRTNAGGTSSLEKKLSVFRQESANEPWTKMSSSVFSETDEVQSNIDGFTNYVIAY